ncbi:hypothetical protein IF2G_00471 [Cordyceps javanica]|nr:hypothetical protein IF2G_00471 [Cordyceps javanica]
MRNTAAGAPTHAKLHSTPACLASYYVASPTTERVFHVSLSRRKGCLFFEPLIPRTTQRPCPIENGLCRLVPQPHSTVPKTRCCSPVQG